MNAMELLGQLEEYQAQRDLMEMDKRRLLDEVKVPAEVIAAQDEANRARQEIDARVSIQQKIDNQDMSDELQKAKAMHKPELPPEYVVAMERYESLCADIMHKYAAEKENNQKIIAIRKAAIDAALTAKTADIYNQLEQRRVEIEAEFGDKAQAVDENIAKLTAEIKAAVIAEGETVKADHYQAVYMPGRTTWKTDTLDKVYFALNTLAKALDDLPWYSSVKMIIDDMTTARKVGAPSVTLRKIG